MTALPLLSRSAAERPAEVQSSGRAPGALAEGVTEERTRRHPYDPSLSEIRATNPIDSDRHVGQIFCGTPHSPVFPRLDFAASPACTGKVDGSAVTKTAFEAATRRVQERVL